MPLPAAGASEPTTELERDCRRGAPSPGQGPRPARAGRIHACMPIHPFPRASIRGRIAVRSLARVYRALATRGCRAARPSHSQSFPPAHGATPTAIRHRPLLLLLLTHWRQSPCEATVRPRRGIICEGQRAGRRRRQLPALALPLPPPRARAAAPQPRCPLRSRPLRACLGAAIRPIRDAVRIGCRSLVARQLANNDRSFRMMHHRTQQ